MMRKPRKKVYCERCGQRTLYHYCEFSSGEVLEDYLCPVCGPTKAVTLVMRAPQLELAWPDSERR